MITIKGGSPKGKLKTGKIVYVGKVKIKDPTPVTSLYPRNDLYPAETIYPKNED